ncbi:MAG: hypothetical protein Q8N73_01715 [bacterium]|nr:hypothetical protein [bacterium]
MKFKEKIKAISLRKLGKSYSEIHKKVRVSKSTLSLWLRGIRLTPEQIGELKGRQKTGYRGGEGNRRKRIERTRQVISGAKKEAKYLFKNPLFLPGLMLYWAEGDKSDDKERVKFSNSDPAMIKFMMGWFRKICKVPEEKFRVALNIHTLHCRKDVENYWSKITQVPLNQFQKTYIKPTSLKHRRNKLYNGTCNIVVCNKDLFRKIKGWKLAFLEKFHIKIKDSDMSP